MKRERGIKMDDSVYEQLHGYYLEDLSVGMRAVFAKTMTDADVLMFAAVSGDTNPLHLNVEFAGKTRFKERLVHGMLTTSLWSTLIGTKLPGPGCAYMGQDLNFYKPVHIDDTVTATVTVVEIIEDKQQVLLDAEAIVREEVVASGRARVWVPRRVIGC